jgi:hypothetical protein
MLNLGVKRYALCITEFFDCRAAKAGTTSLYRYLKANHEIYFPEVKDKEPKFFSSRVCKFPFDSKGDDRAEKNIIKGSSKN